VPFPRIHCPVKGQGFARLGCDQLLSEAASNGGRWSIVSAGQHTFALLLRKRFVDMLMPSAEHAPVTGLLLQGLTGSLAAALEGVQNPHDRSSTAQGFDAPVI
jgi:hypothetical protein